MIKLPEQINNAELMRSVKRACKLQYENDWQPKMQEQAFIKGAEYAIAYLRLSLVSETVCCNHKWSPIDGEGFKHCLKCGVNSHWA